MKNSLLIKGTAALAVGAGLLLGGGGTLAWWNAADAAAPGTVVAGDLNVAKAGPGVWKDRAGNTITIASYKVVPGDKLTFTQDLDVTLEGDKMAATLTASGVEPVNGFTSANVVVTDPVLKGANNQVIANPLTNSQDVTATITFEFKSTTEDRDNSSANYNLGNVSFTLQQIAQTGLE
jgi:alternate signal-mediated exported protein